MKTEEIISVLGKDRSKWPSIAVIILNWNNYEDTSNCIKSLEGINYPEFEVIVVDNGSSDGSIERLQNKFGWCEFVLNDENLGFAKGVNSGVEHQLHQHNYFLVLNNDTIVESNFLTQMVGTAEKSSDIGLIGAKLVYEHKNMIHSAGREYKSFNNIYEGNDPNRLSGLIEVGGIIGACMMISKELIEDIGLFDEDYFFGGEDEDYCLRANENGWRIVVQADAHVVHKSNSTADSSQFRKYHSTKNQIKLRIKRNQFGRVDVIKKILSDSKLFIGYLLTFRAEFSIAIALAYCDIVFGYKHKRTDLL